MEIHSGLLWSIVLAYTDAFLGAKCCLVALNGSFMVIKIYCLPDDLNSREQDNAVVL